MPGFKHEWGIFLTTITAINAFQIHRLPKPQEGTVNVDKNGNIQIWRVVKPWEDLEHNGIWWLSVIGLYRGDYSDKIKRKNFLTSLTMNPGSWNWKGTESKWDWRKYGPSTKVDGKVAEEAGKLRWFR